MSTRRIVMLALLWVMSLFAVATIVKAQGSATEPKVISGALLGFRVEDYRGNTPIGTLVVRVKGKWVAVQFGPALKVQPVTAR